jgi:hypothetical protein
MGKPISQEVFDTLVKNYEELHGSDETYTKYCTVSLDALGIKHPNKQAEAYRVYNGYDGVQTKTILVLVDANGNTLDPGNHKEKKSKGDKPDVAVMDDGPTCPPSC